MYKLFTIIFFVAFSTIIFASEIKNDNNEPGGFYSGNNYATFQESVWLMPKAPCTITKIKAYMSGSKAKKDTLFVLEDPTNGTYPPTKYIWNYSMLTDPIIFDYDGTPGWYEFDMTGKNLRSDGLDRIVIQHIIDYDGPYLTYDNDGPSSTRNSTLCDVERPNPDFYNIRGTKFSFINGDYMVRFEVKWDFPDANGDPLPKPPPVFVDVTKEAGLTDPDGNPLRAALVSVSDWNGDGYDDVAIGANLFQNNGDGTFKNVTKKANLTAGSTCWADYNNDGIMDVLANNGGYKSDTRFDMIYTGKGDGTYLPDENGDLMMEQPTVTPLWLDYNNDGFLDVFIAYGRTSDANGNEVYYQDQLFKNDGNGHFENVTQQSLIYLGEPSPYYDCWAASVCDYNNDNLPDIFVATYRLAPDRLYRNNGDGTFTEVSASTGVIGVPTSVPGYYGHGMGSDWGDFNNDGFVDLAVGNLGHPDERGLYSNPSLIFRNNGAPDFNFTEVHIPMGLKFFEMNAGLVWLDFDLDGYLDICHCHYSYEKRGNEPDRLTRVYLNEGPDKNYHLKDNTWVYGVDVHGAWSPVRIDYDNDGDMDLIIASSNENLKLYRNDVKKRGNWVSFRLKGSPENHVNMDAFGSNITVYCGNDKYYRDLPGSVITARTSQNSNELNFGIGNHDNIDKVVIKYPDGKENTINDLEINTKYVVPYMAAPQRLLLTAPDLKMPLNYFIGVKEGDKLEWSACGGAVSYHVLVSETPDFSTSIVDEDATENNFTLPVLQDHAHYYWKVKSVGNGSESNWSAVWNFNYGIALPGAPGLVEPADNSENITVKTPFKWDESIYNSDYAGKTSYQLQISEQNTFPEDGLALDITDINEITYQPKASLEPGMEYFWRVRGINSGEPGEWSEVYSFTTMPVPLSPAAIEPADSSTDVSVKPIFKWNESEFSDSYSLEIAKDKEFSNITYQREDLSSTVFRLFSPKLDEGTVYFWHIKASNDGGDSPWSDTWSFKTEGVIGVSDSPDPEELGIRVIPNPFSNETEISFYLGNAGTTRIEITDNLGRSVAVLADEFMQPGLHTLKWDCSSANTGIYYCTVFSGGVPYVVKMNVIK